MHTLRDRASVRRFAPIVCLTLGVFGTFVGPLSSQAFAQAPTATASWSFEETSGSVLSSIPSLIGSLVNGASRIATGKVGRGLRFDGVNGYANLGDSSSLKSQAFTISAWVKRNGAQVDYARILNKGNNSAAPWGSYKFEFDGASDTIVRFHIGFTDNTSAIVKTKTALPDNTWAHLTGSYAPTTRTLKVYLDGALQNTMVVASGKTLKFDNVAITVGGTLLHSYFKGDVDEARYYNRTLTDSEVQQALRGCGAPPVAARQQER